MAEARVFSLQVSTVIQYACPEPTDDNEESIDAADPAVTNTCQSAKISQVSIQLTISQTRMRWLCRFACSSLNLFQTQQ